MLPKIWKDDTGQPIAAAMLLKKKITIRGFSAHLSILYIPRGPMLNWADLNARRMVLNDLQKIAHQEGAIFVKIDPEFILGTGCPGSDSARDNPDGGSFTEELHRRGWLYSNEQIQFKNTVWLDLSGDENDWLSRMKQKARYNLRLAQKKGVTVRKGTENDFRMLYQMYAETSLRDHFVIRSQEYYFTVWHKFLQNGMTTPLIAELNGEPLAGIFLFNFYNKAWYIYGMSRQVHRETMPNYLLQWEAMRLAHSLGCTTYDLWGAPDVFDESDSMWGVYRFKEGLGGETILTPGAWDYAPKPWLYSLYTRTLPAVLGVMRKRGVDRVRREVGA